MGFHPHQWCRVRGRRGKLQPPRAQCVHSTPTAQRHVESDVRVVSANRMAERHLAKHVLGGVRAQSTILYILRNIPRRKMNTYKTKYTQLPHYFSFHSVSFSFFIIIVVYWRGRFLNIFSSSDNFCRFFYFFGPFAPTECVDEPMVSRISFSLERPACLLCTKSAGERPCSCLQLLYVRCAVGRSKLVSCSLVHRRYRILCVGSG